MEDHQDESPGVSGDGLRGYDEIRNVASASIVQYSRNLTRAVFREVADISRKDISAGLWTRQDVEKLVRTCVLAQDLPESVYIFEPVDASETSLSERYAVLGEYAACLEALLEDCIGSLPDDTAKAVRRDLEAAKKRRQDDEQLIYGVDPT